MNFYRLSIKSFKATKLFIDIIRYVKDTKERIGCVWGWCVQTFYLSNDPQIYMFRNKILPLDIIVKIFVDELEY